MEKKKYFEAGIFLTGYVRLGVYADTPEEATKIVKDYCDNEGIDSSWIHIASLEVSNVEEEAKRSYNCGHVININIQKFEVGDIVKIVKGYMGNRSDTTYVGCTGKILHVDIDATVFVKLPSCIDGYWFDNDAVELIAETKEDKKPEYEPFDFDDPEVRKELMGKTIINNYGLDGDGEFREVMIVGFMNKSDEDSDCWSSNGDTKGTIAMTVEGYFHADELLKECTFLDGTPCGKLKEDE